MAEGDLALSEREVREMKHGKEVRSALFWLKSVMGNMKWYISLLAILQMSLGIVGVYYAILLRDLVNAAVDGRKNSFFCATASFVGLVVFQAALRAFYRFLEEYSRSLMENCLKARLFQALLTKDYAAVAGVNSAEWMNRLTSDTVVVSDGMAQILPGLMGMAVKMAGALAALLFLEPRFTCILIPGGILLTLCTYGFRKVLKTLHKKIQEEDGKLRVFLQERLNAMLVVRAFAQEQQTAAEAKTFMQSHRAARMRRNHFSNVCNIGFGIAMNGAYVFGAVFCGYGILNGSMSYGNLTAVLQLIGQIQDPFANLTGYLPKYYAMLASAERLMKAEEFGEDCPEEKIPEEDIQVFYSREFCGLSLSDASFSYPPLMGEEKEAQAPPVFSALNLTVQKGEYVAFVGPSGCGKSTVLKLLMGLYQLNGGESCLLTRHGNQPLTSRWRELFAYVPQGNQLMSGTIREIIAFGDSSKMYQEKRLEQSLKIACADGFVRELPQGADTLLGERGTGISEGQMQRIAIARAVFSERPILLLDEATSSLDESVETELLDNLRAMTDKTVIIVTHRMAVLSICDKYIDFGKMRDC